MSYAGIFVASYALAFAGVIAWVVTMNARATERLRANAVTETEIGSFHHRATPPAGMFVRPTLFFGTVLGALGCLGYWLIR